MNLDTYRELRHDPDKGTPDEQGAVQSRDVGN